MKSEDITRASVAPGLRKAKSGAALFKLSWPGSARPSTSKPRHDQDVDAGIKLCNDRHHDLRSFPRKRESIFGKLDPRFRGVARDKISVFPFIAAHSPPRSQSSFAFAKPAKRARASVGQEQRMSCFAATLLRSTASRLLGGKRPGGTRSSTALSNARGKNTRSNRPGGKSWSRGQPQLAGHPAQRRPVHATD